IVYKWTSAAATETATARYTPDVTVTDFYPVYCFTIAGDNRTLQSYRISHSGGVTEVTIDHRLVGNGWIWLGNYYLEVGGDNYIEITNESTETGAIIADAIRWGGGWGDIVRPGPGSVSGYPRDEEAQRYWAEGELGNNAVGFDPYIWDVDGYDDGSDNVRTGAKWAREMNQEPAGGVLVDRWKRIHLEFHTNAAGCPGGPPCGARGQLCLITDLGATTYQVEYALTLSNEVDADMLIMDGEFEHDWFDRFSPTLTGSYGAICTPANGDEFDATIVELAFHDNEEDTELLRDCRVRAAMARSCVQGIIRFLHSLPNSEVPLAFAPDTPRYVRARDLGNGDILLSWEPPLSDEARGDPASGYVVYQSANGYGFGNPIIVGEETAVTISDVPLGETLCLRVAATNNGGESMPSEVLAVRRRSNPDDARILIVNGFDRLRRQINAIQTFTQPPPYAGDSIERQIWWKSNSFDYVMQHAEALAANDYGFDSCSNDAVIDSYVQLRDYKVVVWILGTESSEDATFNSNEQNKVTDFLLDGGGLFVTGSEIAYDLIDQGHGVSFLQDTLRVGYVADDAQTFEVTGTAGSILEGVGPFDFDPAYGAPYEVRSPDVLMPGAEAQECLSYVGGIGGVAGVQYAGVIHHVVTFGFPFETITSVTVRAEIMGPVIEFLALSPGPPPFDYNRDGDVDFQDFTTFLWCFQGPEIYYPAGHTCVDVLGEEDLDIDLADFSVLQRHFTGTGQP
ncbi:MAG: fibronectin type III domain-containing protein, partial [Phycisphaerae bacterium]